MFTREHAEIESGMYEPEYIELAITEAEGRLRGTYRSSFRVPDRTTAPDIGFEFEGAAEGEAPELAWAGRNGMQGQVRLKPLDATSMEVTWWVTKFGTHKHLASGTAVLIRLRQER